MTTPPPKLPSMFEMLLSASANAAQGKKLPWPMNPFPTGIREGSTTDRVLAELLRVHPQALDHGQLRMRCQAGRGAVSWAVRYLAALGKIDILPDHRQVQYKRYRARKL